MIFHPPRYSRTWKQFNVCICPIRVNKLINILFAIILQLQHVVDWTIIRKFNYSFIPYWLLFIISLDYIVHFTTNLTITKVKAEKMCEKNARIVWIIQMFLEPPELLAHFIKVNSAYHWAKKQPRCRSLFTSLLGSVH